VHLVETSILEYYYDAQTQGKTNKQTNKTKQTNKQTNKQTCIRFCPVPNLSLKISQYSVEFSFTYISNIHKHHLSDLQHDWAPIPSTKRK
jgi:Pyruvate/2-oxoacid:ferredoxin oxidoreductase delta subunit